MERHKQNLHVEDLLETSTSAADAERSKPHPDIFQAAPDRRGGVAPGETVVGGDTPYDALAAAKAGMRTVGLLSGGFDEGALRSAGAVEIYEDGADLLDHYDESLLATRAAVAAGL